MYNPKSKEWTENSNENFTEHFETTYYLKYNIEKALYSLNKIFQSKVDYKEFSNRCVYYHFYIDNLLNSVWHIRRRFFNNNIDKEKIERNKKEYNCSFTYEGNELIYNYPTIGDRNIRNFIEHIDEKDEVLIKHGIYYGTFNVIYKGMSRHLKIELLNDNKRQNNLLNLLTKEYKILTVDNKTNTVKEYKINLINLKKELEELKRINDQIWLFLTDKFF